MIRDLFIYTVRQHESTVLWLLYKGSSSGNGFRTKEEKQSDDKEKKKLWAHLFPVEDLLKMFQSKFRKKLADGQIQGWTCTDTHLNYL